MPLKLDTLEGLHPKIYRVQGLGFKGFGGLVSYGSGAWAFRLSPTTLDIATGATGVGLLDRSRSFHCRGDGKQCLKVMKKLEFVLF